MLPVKGLGARTLPVHYLAALVIIAGLSICSLLGFNQLLRTDAESAAIIGSQQRMLSQRIAGLAAQYRLGDRDAAGELLAAVNVLEQEHDRLIAGIGNDPDSDVGRELHSIYFEGPDALDPALRGLIADARRIGTLPPDDASLPKLLSKVFSEVALPLQRRLDAAVSAHQREGERRLSYLQELQWVMLAVVLSTFVFAASGMFRPMTTRMMTYTGQLLNLVTIDALTGVANRRSFLQRGAVELARARRYNRPLSLLMLDADHFKQINDTYGQNVGDEVLKAMTDVLGRGLRSIDVLGRLRGEGFAVLLPETTLAEAGNLAERLREAVADSTVQAGARTVKVTVSMGVVPVPHSLADFATALSAADAAQCRAKSAGRNRVVVDELLSLQT